MIVVGITGNIASGKSTALNFIKKQKIPTHDSDKIVSYLYKNAPKQFISFLKSNSFSRAIKQKKINKNTIRNEVTNNKKKLNALEVFVHQKVKKSRDRFLEKNKKSKEKIVFLDIPLLFEKKLESICDYVFLTYSPLELRKKRALNRKKMNKKTIEKFIKLQIPDKLKIKKADFVINTAQTKTYTNKQIKESLRKILSKDKK